MEGLTDRRMDRLVTRHWFTLLWGLSMADGSRAGSQREADEQLGPQGPG